MSANMSVKDTIKKHRSSTDIEETLVNGYESLYKKVYFLVFCSRIIFLILLFLLTEKAVSLYKYTDTHLESEFSPTTEGVIASALVVILSLFFSFILQGNSFRHLISRNFKKLLNDMEDTIVKLKLEQRFYSDKKLRDKVEDFYIEINNLTRAKYETAFQFYIYEFYIYAVVSSVIAGFFIFKIL